MFLKLACYCFNRHESRANNLIVLVSSSRSKLNLKVVSELNDVYINCSYAGG